MELSLRTDFWVFFCSALVWELNRNLRDKSVGSAKIIARIGTNISLVCIAISVLTTILHVALACKLL